MEDTCLEDKVFPKKRRASTVARKSHMCSWKKDTKSRSENLLKVLLLKVLFFCCSTVSVGTTVMIRVEIQYNQGVVDAC